MLEQKAESIRKSNDGVAGADEGTGPTASKGWIEWCRCMAYDMFVAPLVSSRHPPWYDARGVSIGLIVGLGVPVGAQFITLGVLRSFLRFNLIIALGFSFVSNPFTMIPVYYGYYCLGAFVLGKSVAMDFSVFRKLLHPISNSTYFWEGMAAFANLSKEMLASWIVAAIILSVISGVTGYVVTHKIQKARCIRKAKKMGLEYEKFLQDLEEQFRQSQCSLPARR
jgi:hypothetical protein